jgi:exonuclease SbcD
MRFLHTSDWHVGKPLRNHKRDDEYAAALAEVLEIARDRKVDCLLVAGDIFDTAVPGPEAERIVFNFFGELVGTGIPAIVIAGNHDHPRRWNAYSPVFRHLGIHVLGEPVAADEGGIIKVQSRDESQTATIAALPWVSERKVRDFESLMEEGTHVEEYADGVARMLEHLAKSFQPDTVNILLAHLLLDDSKVGGPESGERELHMGRAYAIKRQRLPSSAQYIALGHVHMPQEASLANVAYCGSLLQCDFGEAGQKKRVNIVDVAPGRKAKVQPVELTSIRQLRNIGSAKAGVTLDELKAMEIAEDDYVKVFVKVDRPLPGLNQLVREIVTNAVDVVVESSVEEPAEVLRPQNGLSPSEQFGAYYESQYGNPPEPALKALFDRLHQEVTSETG